MIRIIMIKAKISRCCKDMGLDFSYDVYEVSWNLVSWIARLASLGKISRNKVRHFVKGL